jgi:hypothetical protein
MLHSASPTPRRPSKQPAAPQHSVTPLGWRPACGDPLLAQPVALAAKEIVDEHAALHAVVAEIAQSLALAHRVFREADFAGLGCVDDFAIDRRVLVDRSVQE